MPKSTKISLKDEQLRQIDRYINEFNLSVSNVISVGKNILFASNSSDESSRIAALYDESVFSPWLEAKQSFEKLFSHFMSYSDPSCTKKILEDYLIFATNTDFAKKYPLVSTYYQMSSNIELICKIIRDGFTLKLISDQLKPNYLEILFAFEKGMNNLTKYVTADINSTFKYITFNTFNNICFYVVEVYTELNQLSEASIYWSIKEAIDQKKLSAMKSELKKGSHISFIEFGDISDFNKFKKNERKTSTTLLGLYYIKLGNIKLAISCYERVNHILDWLYNNGQSNYISMNYMSLGSNIAKYYETAGDFNQAIHYYKRTKSYCDRMLASKRIKAFSCSGYTGELPTGKINKVEIEDAKLWQKNTNEKINTLYSNHSKNLTESEINEHNFCKAFCIKNHYYICFNSHDEAFQFLLIANRHAPNTNFQLYTNNNKTLEVVDFHTLTTIKLHKIFQSYLNRPTIDMPSVTDEEWLIYCEKSTQPTDKDKFSLSFSQKSKKNEASPDLAMSSSKKNEAEEFSLNDVLKASIARKLNCDSNSLVALTDDRIGVHFIKVDKEKINQNDLSKKITDSIWAKFSGLFTTPKIVGAKGSGLKLVRSNKYRHNFSLKAKVGEDIEILAQKQIVKIDNSEYPGTYIVHSFNTPIDHKKLSR